MAAGDNLNNSPMVGKPGCLANPLSKTAFAGECSFNTSIALSINSFIISAALPASGLKGSVYFNFSPTT